MGNVTNRRKFIRIPAQDVLYHRKYSFLSAPISENIKSVLKNISAGGALFESNTLYAVGDVLKMEINLPGWEKFKSEFYKGDTVTKSNPLIVLASVVRVEIIRPGVYDLGMCFVGIDQGHQWALMKYINNKNKQVKK